MVRVEISGKMRALNFDLCEKRRRFLYYGANAMLQWSIMPNHNLRVVKSTEKISGESGKSSTIGCHLPPKSRNFGTLRVTDNRDTDRLS